jgi:hypothetical protein
MNSGADVSLIFQGPVVGLSTDQAEKQITRLCLASARSALPGAEIILSTWAVADVTGLAADKILRNPDPGGWMRDDDVLCNDNRQIVSTRNGLRAATRPYAAKLRSDTMITHAGFLDFPRMSAPRLPGWAIFSERVLTIERYSRDPAKMPLLHHISDIFQFGRREDLLMLWEIPLNTADTYQAWETRHPRPFWRPFPKKRTYQRRASEQYIWLRCVQRKFPDVDVDYLWQMKFSAIGLSESLLTANFMVVTNEQAGIRLPERFATHGWTQTCYESRRWPKLIELYQTEGTGLRRFCRGLGVFVRSRCVLAKATLIFSIDDRISAPQFRLLFIPFGICCG